MYMCDQQVSKIKELVLGILKDHRNSGSYPSTHIVK
jgi:hypothetical protein